MDVEGGWYHVTSRGIERRGIFRNDRDREHFLELLEAMVGRFGVVLHAYVLMDNHWSSLAAYLGAVSVPEWLTTAEILRRAHRDAERRIPQYRADTEGRLTKGVEPATDHSTASFAIGTSGFVEHVRKQARIGREVAEPKGLRRGVAWSDLLMLAQRVTGESLGTVPTRRGSVGRPLLLWAARRYGRMTLREAGDALGGRDYTAVARAIRRFETNARTGPGLLESIEKMRHHCEE